MRKSFLVLGGLATLFIIIATTLVLPIMAKPIRFTFADFENKHSEFPERYVDDPDAWGWIVYETQAEGFSFWIVVKKLKPNHTYMLCLNGKPWPGHGWTNDVLLTHYERWVGEDELLYTDDDEGYYDFVNATTNPAGNLRFSYLVELPKEGDYKLTFLIKDIAEEWRVVLSADFLAFTVVYS